LFQNGPELWKWIQEGVSIYVWGDASRMAKNVHGALCTIAEKEGSMSADSGQDRSLRYHRDVY
jgi:sulfite reductase (NADPH) flavoprotein alpha-component